MSTYYVAKTGSDEFPGTVRYPYLTIAEGLHSLENGDTLYVFGGTYEEDFTFVDSPRAYQPVAIWLEIPRIVAYPGEVVNLISTSSNESKTLGYFYLKGFDAVQDPANYAGVTLTDISNQRDSTEPIVHGLAYIVGGGEYVANAPADITKPIVTISSPAHGDVVSGITEIDANCSDAVGIESIWIKLDGVTLHSEYPEDYCEFSWDTSLSLNGEHTLIAWAKDTSGNIGVSNPITVNVDNVPPLEAASQTLLIPSITITRPISGDLWRPGNVVNITWTSIGIEGNLDAYFIADGLPHQIFSDVPNNGVLSWTIIGKRGPHCQIRLVSINNLNVFGVSQEFNLV